MFSTGYQLIASCQATINKIKPKVTAADVQTCSHMHHGKKPRGKQEVLHKHSQSDSRSQQVPDCFVSVCDNLLICIFVYEKKGILEVCSFKFHLY